MLQRWESPSHTPAEQCHRVDAGKVCVPHDGPPHHPRLLLLDTIIKSRTTLYIVNLTLAAIETMKCGKFTLLHVADDAGGHGHGHVVRPRNVVPHDPPTVHYRRHVEPEHERDGDEVTELFAVLAPPFEPAAASIQR